MVDMITGLVGAGITLAMWSFMYRENSWYRFLQHLLVGTWMGFVFTQSIDSVIDRGIKVGLEGNPIALLAVLLGLLIPLRYLMPSLGWYARLPVLLIVAVGYGVALVSMVKAQIVDQLIATMLPLNSLNNIIVVGGVIMVIFYFFFSVEHTGTLGYISKGARYIMMISFGANYGYGFMARVGRVIEPLKDLVLVWPNILLVPVALALIGWDYFIRSK